MEAHLNPTSGIDKSWIRNASLAQVKLLFDSSSAFSSSQQGRVSAIVKYLQGYGNASTAYNDLRLFVEQLNSNERKQLLEILKGNTVFLDAHETGDGQYPTKEDVNSRSYSISCCIEDAKQRSILSFLPNSSSFSC